MSVVKASTLVAEFQIMACEKWKYIAGAHEYGAVDCSGAFYYAYKKHGSYMYHGSNTMWRKYTVNKGKIGSIDLVPGMAVFKCRDWNANNANNGWYGDSPGDVYHVGLYMGNGIVAEAKGTKYGFVLSNIKTWYYAAELVDTEYDMVEGDSVISDAPDNNMEFPFFGVVTLENHAGYLNLRNGPSTNNSRIGKAWHNDVVCVTGQSGGWYIIDTPTGSAYASKDYITLRSTGNVAYVFTVTVSHDQKAAVEQALNGFDYSVAEKWSAA
jgi:hypothetical protein